MKKTLILCGLAAFAALTASAECEKMSFFKNGMPSHNVVIDANSTVNYSGQGGYTHMRITNGNGDTKEIALEEFDQLSFADVLKDNPLTVEVDRHYNAATLHITTSDPNAWYRFSGMPTRHLEHIDKSAWADYLVQDDFNYIYSVAESAGTSLGLVPLDDIFDQGDQVRDWFPSEVISTGTPIALAAYTARIVGGKLQLTSEPLLIEFTTKKQEALPVKFNISADMTSTRLTVKYDPVLDEELVTEDNKDTDPANITYLTALYDAYDFVNYGLDQLVYNTIAQAENMVYKYGYEWEDVTSVGHSEKTYNNRRTGDLWIACAFGIEYGVMTTYASVDWFEIPMAEVVNDCKFTLSYTQKNPAEVEVKVVPSDPETNYVAILARKSRLTGKEDYDPAEYYFANKVYYVNAMNTFQWHSTEYLHQGEFTFRSKEDLVDGEYLQVGTEYVVLVAGIDEVGTRLTELAVLPVSTSADEVNKVTFDIKFKDFINDQYYHWITLDITPSDPNARYIVHDFDPTNAYAKLDGRTDEQIINDLTAVNAERLKFHTGAKDVSVYDGGVYYGGDTFYKGRRIMVFGYDGIATSDLYVFDWDSTTGEIVQMRGPEVDCTLQPSEPAE